MRRLSFFILLIMFVFAHVAVSQAAQIKGVITDAENGDPLPGANVEIDGTSLGASTDLNGYYSIPNVPQGSWQLKVSYIGYYEKTVSVEVTGNKDVRQDIALSYGALFETETIEVTAQARGQMEAINQQLSSMKITSVVAADRIQEVPDANAAESVGRLPGVAIKRSSGEGNEVVIRGLQPRLNLITINNIRMPSTNQNNTAVGLAGISQYMLDGIEVRKSLTAEDDADVVGGIVDLKLATAPEGYHFNTIVEGMYNGLTQNYGSYRAMFQGSSRFFNNNLGVIAQFNIERADRTRERYTAGYNKDERVSENLGVFLTGGQYQLHDIKRDRFGWNLIADYKLPAGKIQFNSIYNNLDEDLWMRDWYYNVAAGSVNAQKFNTSVKVRNNSIINGLNLETGLFGFAFFDFGAAITNGEREEPENNSLRFTYDPGSGSPIDPEFVEDTYGKTGYDVIPYFRDLDDEYIISGAGQDIISFRENETTLQSNLRVPFNLLNKLSGAVKFGGKMRFKDRTYDFEQNGGFGFGGGGDPVRTAILRDNPEIDWPIDWRQRQQGTEIMAYPLYADWTEKVLKDRVLLDGFSSQSLVDQIINRLDDARWGNVPTYLVSAADLQNDYEGDEKLYAGYIMGEVNWNKWMTLNAGLRHEHEETNYSGYGVIDIASSDDVLDTLETVKRVNHYLLPNASLRINYTNWADVRVAWSKSLARPEYYAFIPHYYADLRLSFSSAVGNTHLRPAVSENFDLIFSFYTNEIGLFTIGGFYKKIDDFFYNRSFKVIDVAEDNLVHDYSASIKVPKGQYINVWFNNTEQSTVKGLEFDWQTHFWYLPKPLNGLVLSVNYAIMSSESFYYVSDVRKEYYGTRPWEFTEIRVDSFETRRLIDQPNNTFNFSIGYDYKGFSFRTAYYFQGNTLVGKGDTKENDTYGQNYKRLDVSLRQKLPVDGLSAYVLWNNITGVPDEQYRWIKDFNTLEEYYGSTGSVGLRYQF